MGDRPLTAKQQAFIAAYVGEAMGVATEAARMAGYTGSDATLAVTGCELLKHPKVRHALDIFRLATAKPAIMDAQEAAERLSKIARGGEGLTETRTINAGPAGFVDTETPPNFDHQIRAIERLAKMRGYDQPKNEPPTAAAPPSAELQAALIEFAKARTDEETWQAFLRYREEKGV